MANELKKELKIALVLDDYKLPQKETLWKAALAKVKDLDKYEYLREEAKPGITPDTTSLFRYFKLIEK